MFERIRNRRGRVYIGRKHGLLKARNERCGVDRGYLAERLSRYGVLDMYSYWDAYAGHEEDYMPDIYGILDDPESMDAVIFDMQQTLEEADDWTDEDYKAWGMSKAEVRSLLEDLRRHRRCLG